MTNPPPADGIIKLLTRRNIIDSDQKLTFSGHVALTSGLLVLTGVTYIFGLYLSTFWEGEWLRKEIETPPLVKQTELFNKQTLNPEDRQQLRLVEQLNTVNDLRARHCRIMSFFYKQYFCWLSIGGTAAMVSLLCIFFISKEGWKETNNALINVGVTSFGITLFALNTTQVFQQSENLKTSQNLYIGYVGLEHDLRSAIATKELIKSDKTVIKLDTKNGDYTQLIQDVDAQMKVLNLIRLGFDPTPISDLRTRLDSTIGISTSIKQIELPKPVAPTPSPK
jgi:hypothetical protein